MKSYLSVVLIGIVLSACTPVNVFDQISTSVDSTYGYTANNPIRTGYWDLMTSMQAQGYFMNQLATQDSVRLHGIMAATISAPYKNSKPVLPKRFGPMGNGGMMDKYTVVTDDLADTLTLYFDPNTRGEKIMAPVGLIFLPR